MKYQLLQVTTDRAFLIPQLQHFMLKALATSKLINDAEAALLEITDFIHTGLLGVFLTVDDKGEFAGMALAETNISALSPGCIVLHFYNCGEAESRNLLIRAVIDFAKDAGMTKIRGFDANNRPAAFARLFKAAGQAKSFGHGYEFDL